MRRAVLQIDPHENAHVPFDICPPRKSICDIVSCRLFTIDTLSIPAVTSLGRKRLELLGEAVR